MTHSPTPKRRPWWRRYRLGIDLDARDREMQRALAEEVERQQRRSRPFWTPPHRHIVELMALSLWLDGEHDKAREALSPFTALGAADFTGRLNRFREAVIAVGEAKLAEMEM